MGWSKVAILIVKPLDILKQAIGKNVIVVLKGKREYRGVLDGYDPHMNLVLKNAEELVSGESVGERPRSLSAETMSSTYHHKEKLKWEQEQQHREGTTSSRRTFPAAGAESARTTSGREFALPADTARPQG